MREDFLYRYYMPTEVVMGVNALEMLPEYVGRYGERPLLVTGKHAARQTGMLDQALAVLPNAVLFDAVEENPSTRTCEAGAMQCSASECDCVVALGGGSAMDAAKAIALLAVNPGHCADYFGGKAPHAASLPIIAIPTTAGTGSETTPYAVLIDEAHRTKRTIGAPDLFPKLALLDPGLTTTMPRAVTLSTGLDVLSQGMEGLLSRKATRPGDILALEICRLVAQWLPTALREPENMEARAGMMEAAMLSGCVIAQSGTTLVHGMGYYLTLNHNVPHGLANAMLLGPVFQWNARHAPAKVALLCDALGCPVASLEPTQVAISIYKALHALYKACDWTPQDTTTAYDIDIGSLPDYAADIHGDAYRFKNQIGDFSLADIITTFRAACTGESL